MGRPIKVTGISKGTVLSYKLLTVSLAGAGWPGEGPPAGTGPDS
jgi:hypothetical protein